LHKDRIAAAKPAVFGLMAIIAIGWALARMAQPHWQSCELILLVAYVALVWETLRSHPNGTNTGWFEVSSADLRDAQDREFRPWDVEQAIARLGAAARKNSFFVYPSRASRQSFEQLTNEMLTEAFRHGSPRHYATHR